MGVDLLRSCYESDFHFFRGRPDLVTRVRWYFVPADTPLLPLATVFVSQVWQLDDPPSFDLGEQLQPRPWRGGLPLYPPGPGTGYCGSEHEWAEGCEVGPALPRYPDSTLPLCCPPPVTLSTGGIGWGGISPADECCAEELYPDHAIVRYNGADAPGPFPVGTLWSLTKESGFCPVEGALYRYRSDEFTFPGVGQARWFFFCLAGFPTAGFLEVNFADCSGLLGTTQPGYFSSCSPFLASYDIVFSLPGVWETPHSSFSLHGV